jgi:hypothetical protein
MELIKFHHGVHSSPPLEFTAFDFRDVETPIISPNERIPVLQETLEMCVAVLTFYRFVSCIQVKFGTRNRKLGSASCIVLIFKLTFLSSSSYSFNLVSNSVLNHTCSVVLNGIKRVFLLVFSVLTINSNTNPFE